MRRLEAIVKFVRLAVSVVPRCFQIRERGEAILASDFDQSEVVMDHSSGFVSRGCGDARPRSAAAWE